MIAHN